MCDKWVVSQLVGTLLGAAEGLENGTKVLHTLHYAGCVQEASAVASDGRRDHAGSQESFLSGCHVLSIMSRSHLVRSW